MDTRRTKNMATKRKVVKVNLVERKEWKNTKTKVPKRKDSRRAITKWNGVTRRNITTIGGKKFTRARKEKSILCPLNDSWHNCLFRLNSDKDWKKKFKKWKKHYDYKKGKKYKKGNDKKVTIFKSIMFLIAFIF